MATPGRHRGSSWGRIRGRTWGSRMRMPSCGLSLLSFWAAAKNLIHSFSFFRSFTSFKMTLRVQDDMMGLLSQILHSACGSVQDDKRGAALFKMTWRGFLTCAYATLILRFERHFVSAHLDFFLDKCASKPCYTLWEAFSLRMSHLLNWHLRSRSPFYGIYSIFPAHVSVFPPTCASAIPIIQRISWLPCAHLPCGNEMWIGTANMRLLEDAGL